MYGLTRMVSVPQHLGSAKPGLEPYGQLLRMLVPRASGIGFYDARGTALWVSDNYDGPDPQPVVEQALAKVPPATTGQIDGFSRNFEGAPAYAFRLRDDAGHVIAVAVLLVRDGEERPYSFIQHLAQPALECLSRELLARSTLGIMSRDLRARDDDLDLLLKVAPDDPDNPEQGDELGLLVQTCVDHLGCTLGALVVPERNVALCKATVGCQAPGLRADGDPPAPAQLGPAATPHAADQQGEHGLGRAAAGQGPLRAGPSRVGPGHRVPGHVPRG